ncbi:MAG: cell division protein FtsQ/DivIB [Christensenellales bacterium]|jgi:cell division protein FtsQ
MYNDLPPPGFPAQKPPNNRRDGAPHSASDGHYQPSMSQEVMPPFVRLVLLMVSLVVIFLIFQQFIIKIRRLEIYGAAYFPKEVIAKVAGIDSNSNYFNVREKDVRERINAQRYLKFLSFDKKFPSTVYLSIKERIPVAFTVRLGIIYIIADDGVILEQGNNLNTAGLIRVSGLLIQQIAIGSTPQLSSVKQLKSYKTLLTEIQLQRATSLFTSISFADSDNIYLISKSGFTVHLGSGDFLRAKLGTVRAVLIELEKQNIFTGVIEATIPGEATYRPENK